MATSTTFVGQTPIAPEKLPSFETWLREKLSSLTLPVLIALLNFALGLFSYFGKNALSQTVSEILQKYSQFAAHVFQFFLIFVLLLLVPKSFESINDSHAKATGAAEYFRESWLFTLFAWLILYAIFAVESWPSFQSDIRMMSLLHVLDATASCLSTLGFWKCFLTVSNPDRRADSWKWMAAILFLIVLKSIALYFFKSDGLDLMTNLSIGALSGVAMAFFIGRLESRLLRPPRWLLMALYCYAVVQFGYGFLQVEFVKPVNWQPFFFFFVLLLKILLALFVSWLVGTGNLLFYLRFVSELNRDYSDYSGRRAAFLAEIK